MSNPLTTLVTVFDGTNFALWSRQMRAYLQSQGLWGYCTGTITKPTYRPAVKAQAYVPADPTTRTPKVKEVKAQNDIRLLMLRFLLGTRRMIRPSATSFCAYLLLFSRT